MAAGTALSLVVAPRSTRVSFLQRLLGTLLITLGVAIAILVPVLLTGVTGYNLWVGEGKSMEPTFHAGEFMITKEVPAGELQPGDVILFKSGIKHVMHRVVSVSPTGDSVVTRGDNNPADDPPVPADAIVGKLAYEVGWLPRSPVSLSGTGIIVAEWLVAVALISAGIVLKRFPAHAPRAPRPRPARA